MLDNFGIYYDTSSEYFVSEDILHYLLREYQFRQPIIIPNMTFPIIEEPILDFVIRDKEYIFRTPSSKKGDVYDVYPEETYKNLYLDEGEKPILLEHL